jgi:hypothetical protein
LVANNGTGDGRTYSYDLPTANSEDTYNGREEYAASQLAAGWLALYVSHNAWDKAFNLPAVDGATYAPLPPLTKSATGWSSVPAQLQPGRGAPYPLRGSSSADLARPVGARSADRCAAGRACGVASDGSPRPR